MKWLAVLGAVLWAGLASAQGIGVDQAKCEPETLRVETETLTPEAWERIAAEGDAIEYGTGRLWRVTTEDGAVSHVWGTMHSPDPRIALPPEAMLELLRGSRKVWTELSAVDMSADWLKSRYMGDDIVLMTPPPIYLNDLGDVARHMIEDRLADLGLGEAALDYLRPHVALEMLLSFPCDDRLSGAGYPIQDVMIEVQAVAAGLPIASLEPLGLMEEYGEAPEWRDSFVAALMLFGLGSGYEMHAMHLDTLPGRATGYQLYLEGRIGRLMVLEREVLGSIDPQLDMGRLIARADRFLLTERNRRMVLTVEPELAKGGAFVAVGAAHLPGGDGVLARLEAAGHRVERIQLPGEAR